MTYKELYKAFKEGKRIEKDEIPLESYFQRKIIDYLKTLPNCFYWKAQAGAYSQKGIPDICCVIDGCFYGFEVKRPWLGNLSKVQEQTMKQINAAGGKAYVVCFVEQVMEILSR